MTKGRVVLVPFPFDDLSATKVRPAVCLTNELLSIPGFEEAFRRAVKQADRGDVVRFGEQPCSTP